MKVSIHLAGCAAGIAALVLVLAGCEAPAPTTASFSHLRLPSTSKTVAFEAAAAAMRERYQIDRADLATGVITGVPEERNEPGATGQVGDALGTLRRVRRLAKTRITGSDTSADLWCRVTVERYETPERGLFLRDQNIADAPTQTPIDRGSAATAEQNAIWRVSHRDKAAERGILRSVREIVSQKQPASPPGR